MELEKFNKLEKKITKVVEVIDKLRQENQQISSSYAGLSLQVSRFEEKTKDLSLENEKLRKELKQKEGDFKNRKDKTKRQLERLLAKLTFLDDFD